MTWTFEQKRDACLRAPMRGILLRADTEVIARDGWYEIVTPSASGSMLNEVVLSVIDEREVESVIDATLAAHPNGVKWCVGYWTSPSDLGERLARRRFSSWEIRGMGCSTSLALDPPRDVVVRRVGTHGLSAFVDLAMRGWGMPLDQSDAELATHRRAFEDGTAAFFIAELDGAPVGTAAMIFCGDHGYLVGTQVLGPARGRGAYRALVAARLRLLAERNIAYAVTQAREATSAPLLEKLGFETLFASRCYVSPSP